MAAPSIHRDPTDVLGRRFGAYVIDGVIAIVLMLAIGIPMLRGAADVVDHQSDRVASDFCRQINRDTFDADGNGEFGTDAEPDQVEFSGEDPFCFPLGNTTYTFTGNDLVGLYVTLVLLNLGFSVVNMALLPGLAGGSLGKLALGLRVVQADGSKAGIGRSIVRWVLWVVDGMCFLGVIMVCVSKGHRRLGDMAAGTFVVGKEHLGQPINVPGVTTAPHGAPAYPGAPVAGAAWAPPVAPAAPSADGPTWDAARNAYIQWDPAQNSWVQWDEATSTWTPIS